MYCKHCGAQLPDNTKFCGACGTKQDISTAATGRFNNIDTRGMNTTQRQPSQRKPFVPNKAVIKIENLLVSLMSIFIAFVVIVDTFSNRDAIEAYADLIGNETYVAIFAVGIIVLGLMVATLLSAVLWRYEKSNIKIIHPMVVIAVVDFIIAIILKSLESSYVVLNGNGEYSVKTIVAALFNETGDFLLVVSLIILAVGIIRTVKQLM